MPLHLEYHPRMRYWMPVLAVLLVSFLTLSASAQANGVPPSVTSFGFGGHPGFNGPPPNVTSLGPQGAVPPQRVFHQPPFRPPQSGTHHHHNQNQGFAYPYYVPYYIPYYPVMDPNDASAADDAEAPEDPNQYQGGPTIFDRRGPGDPAPNDYRAESPRTAPPRPPSAIATPAMTTKSVAPAVATSPEASAPEAPRAPGPRAPEPIVVAQPSTILIFKDGHKQEVSNYAIVGSNLFDLTPGHRLKIALSDLDLPATQKANDEQGVDFKLPESPGN
jgi:hypothetical protein